MRKRYLRNEKEGACGTRMTDSTEWQKDYKNNRNYIGAI